MSGWTVTNLALLAGAAIVGRVAFRHLLRSDPSPRRRREAALLGVVTAMAVGGFALAHAQLNVLWGASPFRVGDRWWLVYAVAFSASLWFAHLLLRRIRVPVDDVVLPVVGVAMLFGLLNVWIWETRDANAFVSSVALPEMREFELRIQSDEDLDSAVRTRIELELGEVPNELDFGAGRGPANVLNPAWVDEFNGARGRYSSAVAIAPESLPTKSLPPVIVDNLFRRQLMAVIGAVLAIPLVVVAIQALSGRSWARRACLIGGSVLLSALALFGMAQGTSGRLPAFVQVGNLAVTVFAVSALITVVVLPLTVTAYNRMSPYWWVGAAAVFAATFSMIAIDTGAGILLALLVGAGLTARLTQPWRGVAYAIAVGSLLTFTIGINGGDTRLLPQRAVGRLESWIDPWTSHNDAEAENAAVRSIEAISHLGDTQGASDLAPLDAAALIDRELSWRLDSFDGQPIETSPVIPRSRAEELLLREAELLWSDLGGYRVDDSRSAQHALSARIELATRIVDDAALAATTAREGDLSDLTATPRADTLQLQRSLYGLGAGGLLGVGLAMGHPEAIPEITEDMAIVFIGEAFGLIGVSIMVGLVILLASRSIERSRSLIGSSAGILAGIGVLLGVQAIVNLGGVTGALPLTGIPFPMISRTGTGALITAAGTGITLALAAGVVGQPRLAPYATRLETANRARSTRDPLVLTTVILLANLAAIQMFGRQLAPGPVGASVPPNSSELLTASNSWDLPDYRTAPGAIEDRNGNVLAETTALGLRSYPDSELAESLSHSLAELERHLPSTDGALGPTMITTIDSEVQRAVHRAIDAAARESDLVTLDDLRGAVVVVDVSTGELIAIESRPTFSPSELTDDDVWARAEGDERRSGFYFRHLNRALDGSYPPGSVAKIITAAASLEHDLHEPGEEDFDFRAGPLAPRPPDDVRHFGIWHEVEFDDGGTISDGHLSQIDEWLFDIEEAFAYSSNVAFALMAVELGSDRLTDEMRAFGYEEDHVIPYYGSYSATIGAADDQGARYVESGPTNLAQTGMGQGETLTSPIHLSLVSAAVANDGVAMSPYIVAAIEHPGGEQEVVGRPTPLFDTGLSDDTLDDLALLMAAAVDYGTASNAASPSTDPALRPAGKTGSAQWSEDLDRTHSVFTGYYPRSDPRLAIAVIVERGGPGGGIAAGITRHLFESDAVALYLASVPGGEDET